jgi:hypothetical protein
MRREIEADAARAIGQSPDPGLFSDPPAQRRILPLPAAGKPIRRSTDSCGVTRAAPVAHCANAPQACVCRNPRGVLGAPHPTTRRTQPGVAAPGIRPGAATGPRPGRGQHTSDHAGYRPIPPGRERYRRGMREARRRRDGERRHPAGQQRPSMSAQTRRCPPLVTPAATHTGCRTRAVAYGQSHAGQSPGADATCQLSSHVSSRRMSAVVARQQAGQLFTPGPRALWRPRPSSYPTWRAARTRPPPGPRHAQRPRPRPRPSR